ncbi:MAG: hypothetical protein FWE78_03750, partial [Methanimicrococcus sp.]|nr:hypothetical protein [Methanimicrococcus sp.]
KFTETSGHTSVREKAPDLIIRDYSNRGFYRIFGKLRGIKYKDDKVYKNFDFGSRISILKSNE